MRINSKNFKQTIKIGKFLSQFLKPKDILALFGNLGSGKTTFVKGIAQGLGMKEKEVNSPSFIIIKIYKSKIPIYHFDFYRIKRIKDILNLGCEEFFEVDGISIVEWADRLGMLLPENYLEIRFKIKGIDKREIEFKPHGKRYEALLKELKKEYENIRIR